MSQFDTLSPLFRDSLLAVADGMAKKAQCPAAGKSQKEQAVNDVIVKIQGFQDRFVKEWLYGLDEQDISKVGGLFDEINNLSVPEACELMAKSGECCPFGLVASMLGGAAKAGEGDVEVVVEEASSAPSPTENAPPEETRQEQEPSLLNTLIGQ